MEKTLGGWNWRIGHCEGWLLGLLEVEGTEEEKCWGKKGGNV